MSNKLCKHYPYHSNFGAKQNHHTQSVPFNHSKKLRTSQAQLTIAVLTQALHQNEPGSTIAAISESLKKKSPPAASIKRKKSSTNPPNPQPPQTQTRHQKIN